MTDHSTQTLRTTWRIVRDDGEVMDSGLDEATARHRFKVYDASEYRCEPWSEYVDAEPLPFYPGPIARLWARLLEWLR
jgi:hypothetical protein